MSGRLSKQQEKTSEQFKASADQKELSKMQYSYDDYFTSKTITASDLDDDVFALVGQSLVYGGDGNDTISAGGQTDTLHGGRGQDIFSIIHDKKQELQKHIILDYDHIEDSIDFSSFEDVFGSTSFAGFSRSDLSGEGLELILRPDSSKKSFFPKLRADLLQLDFDERESEFFGLMKDELGHAPDVFSKVARRDSAAIMLFNDGEKVLDLKLFPHLFQKNKLWTGFSLVNEIVQEVSEAEIINLPEKVLRKFNRSFSRLENSFLPSASKKRLMDDVDLSSVSSNTAGPLPFFGGGGGWNPFNKVKRGFKDLGNNIVNTTKDAGKAVKNVAQDVGKGVKDVAEDVGKGVKDAAEEVKDVAEDVGKGVKDVAEDVGKGVKDTAEDLVEGVNDLIGGGKDVVNDVAGGVQDVVEDGKGLADDVAGGVKDVVEDGKDFAEDLIDDVQDSVDNIVDEAGSFSSNVVDEIVNTAKKIGDFTVEATHQAKNGVEIALTEAVNYSGQAKDVFEEGMDIIVDTVSQVGEVIVEVAPQVADTVIWVIGEYGARKLDFYGNVFDAAGVLLSRGCRLYDMINADLLRAGCDFTVMSLQGLSSFARTGAEATRVVTDLIRPKEKIFEFEHDSTEKLISPITFNLPGTMADFVIGPYVTEPKIKKGSLRLPQLVNFQPSLHSDSSFDRLAMSTGFTFRFNSGPRPFEFDTSDLTFVKATRLNKFKRSESTTFWPYPFRLELGAVVEFDAQIKVDETGVNKEVNLFDAGAKFDYKDLVIKLPDYTVDGFDAKVSASHSNPDPIKTYVTTTGKEELTGISIEASVAPGNEVTFGLGFDIGEGDLAGKFDAINLQNNYGPKYKFEVSRGGLDFSMGANIKSELNFFEGEFPMHEFLPPIRFKAGDFELFDKFVPMVEETLI